MKLTCTTKSSKSSIVNSVKSIVTKLPVKNFVASALLIGITGSMALDSFVLTAPSYAQTDSQTKVRQAIHSSCKSLEPSDTLLGHLSYAEAPKNELESLVPNGKIQLRTAAAKQFIAMVKAAAEDGVILVPLSGFRSLVEQQHLFFDVKAERGQTTVERVKVSAPPGYSEHHTGYAIDIGDGSNPNLNLSPSFDSSAAFNWLNSYATHFSFEISFPRDNCQGISYEPWHWRFLGDIHSLETFYKARNGGTQDTCKIEQDVKIDNINH